MSIIATDGPFAEEKAGLATASASRAAAAIAARLERLPLTSYQRGIFLIIATAWFFDSLDLGALTFVLGSIKTDFGLSAAQAGLLSSTSFLGMFLGASTAGLLADRFGRKAVFQVSMIFWGLGSIFCGLAPNVELLGLARILLGFGMGMEFPCAQSMLSEIMPAKNRGRYIAYLEGFWPIGFIASGLLCYAVLSFATWRWVFIIEGLPAIFVLIVRRKVPESPRWLAARGRTGEAERVMDGIEAQVRNRLPAGNALAEPGTSVPAPLNTAGGISALFGGNLAKRTVMLWSLWFFALLGFYGLTTWLGALLQQKGFPVTKSVFYTVLISLAGIPGFLTSAWLLERIGRKVTLIAMLLGSACAAYFYGTAVTLEEVIVFGLCLQFCQFGMWSVLYAYTPELYPTRIRATGAGCASAVGRLGSLVGPYVIGIVLPVAGQNGVFTLGAGAFVLAAAVVLFLGEETRGRVLEDIAR
ncbi:MAG: MFS transporter [Beijerinckiaceae bacterium]|jgi:putative MFS transporter